MSESLPYGATTSESPPQGATTSESLPHGATTSESLLLRDGCVVTMDDARTVIPSGDVLVSGETIEAVGPTGSLHVPPGTPIVELAGAMLLPGLVNSHTHLAMTLFRGLADDVDLEGFLGRIMPAEAAVLDTDSIADGVRLAVAESLLGGVTAAIDMYFWDDVAADVAAEWGFHLAGGPAFLGGGGPEGEPFDAQLERATERWAGADDVVGPWAHPHATYTLSPEQLSLVATAARDAGARLHLHAAESASEVETVLERTGRRPVELLDDLGLLAPDVVLAHAVHLTDHEVARIAATGTSVAHCPASNLKLASGIARIPDLLDAGVTIGLGTDGPASSNDLDVFAAARLAALLHKGVRGDATVVPAPTALAMATIDGARLLGADDRIGSIEAGKRADVVRLDQSAPHLTPDHEPLGNVIYAAGRGDVTDVWLGGRRVVSAGELVGVDADRIRRRVVERIPAVRRAVRSA